MENVTVPSSISPPSAKRKRVTAPSSRTSKLWETKLEGGDAPAPAPDVRAAATIISHHAADELRCSSLHRDATLNFVPAGAALPGDSLCDMDVDCFVPALAGAGVAAAAASASVCCLEASADEGGPSAHEDDASTRLLVPSDAEVLHSAGTAADVEPFAGPRMTISSPALYARLVDAPIVIRHLFDQYVLALRRDGCVYSVVETRSKRQCTAFKSHICIVARPGVELTVRCHLPCFAPFVPTARCVRLLCLHTWRRAPCSASTFGWCAQNRWKF